MLRTKIVLNVKTKQKQQFVYTTCSAGILSLQFSRTMNNLLSYCGLVDAKIRASDKDLPVSNKIYQIFFHILVSSSAHPFARKNAQGFVFQ